MINSPKHGPAVCTLLENDFHYGLAALANSLHHCGYQGVIFAGFRGALPPWALQVEVGVAGKVFTVNETLKICFVPLTTKDHLTFYKPRFMQEVFARLAPEASAVIYLDPDIVLKAPWDFFVNWVKDHIALCEDLNWRFHRSHPIRREWRRYFEPFGLDVPCQLDVYFNAGFVGIDRRHIGFLDKWLTVLDAIRGEVEGCTKMTIADRSFAFHKGDQDAMNIAADIFAHQMSIMGPEGMDFIPGGYTMSHAVGNPKPWNKNFIQCALRGVPPTATDKAFLEHAREPIALYDATTLQLKCWELKVGSAIGRLVRRT